MLETELVTYDITSGKMVLSEPLKFKSKRLESVYPSKRTIVLDVKNGIWTSTLKHCGKGDDFISFALISYLDELDIEKGWDYLGSLPTKSGDVVLFDSAYLENGFGMPIYGDFSNIFHLHNFTKNGKAVPVFSLLDADYLGVAIHNESFVSDYEVHVQYTDAKVTAVKITFRKDIEKKNL